MFALKPIFIRLNFRTQAKKNDSVEPVEAPARVHPLKKFIMEKFKIVEIDYEKFNKDNKWAIRPDKDKK